MARVSNVGGVRLYFLWALYGVCMGCVALYGYKYVTYALAII
jgi:hypothetical protein